MIELKKSGDNVYNLRLYVDGIWSKGASIRPHFNNSDEGKKIGIYDIRLRDKATSKLLLPHLFSDLPHFTFLGFILEFDWTSIINYVRFKRLYNEEEEQHEIIFRFSPDFSRWKSHYNFADYVEIFSERVKENSNGNVEMTRVSRSEFILSFFENPKFFRIGDVISHYENFLKKWHVETEEILLQNYNNETVVTSFDFPDPLKVSCEQYLLYFAQFLQDLGIDATSNLKEEVGKILFSVTPTDDVEALDKIREALAVYLNLPTSPIVYDDSFAAMRLQQQIENLQHSQKMAVREIQVGEKLLLVQSDMIREKNLTISQQQTVIEQKDKIIEKISSKSIMMDSVENKEELEEICDGLQIGKSKFLMEQLGIHLNPATLAKGVGKKILGKQEETSILELNEEKEIN